MCKYVWLGVFVALLAVTRAHGAQPVYDERTMLANWAMARCVARAYDDAGVRKDAEAAAAAYMEFGHSDMEAYAAIDRLVAAQLEKDYASASGEKLSLMKCIDLMHSTALRELIEAYVRVRVG